MTDIVFVAGAYLTAFVAIGVYAAMLVRRVRVARSARAAIDERRSAGMGARVPPEAR